MLKLYSEKIVQLLEKYSRISVLELTELLHLSSSTVRRVLTEMEQDNLICRYHGGAMLRTMPTEEEPMRIKQLKNLQIKEQIAKTAAGLIQDQQKIYLDAGSTTQYMIPYITAKQLTVVTTGIPHLQLLMRYNINTMVLGGTLKTSTEAVVGEQVVDMLSTLNFDLAFIGANGVHTKTGYSTPSLDERITKKIAIRNSKHAYILADSSKMNKVSFHSFAELSEATLITNRNTVIDYSCMNVIFVPSNAKSNY